VFKLGFEYVRSEMNTQFANIATPTEIVVASSFSVDFGSAGGDIHLCMPYAMLEPIRDIIYSSFQADRNDADARWVSMLTAQVQEAEVELSASLATTTVTLGQIADLQVGDVIALDMPESVVAQVDGVPFLECKYGVSGGHYALKVVRVLAGRDA
jgi:flagellar motor switch protein FliM